jgi:hypothetical protein
VYHGIWIFFEIDFGYTTYVILRLISKLFINSFTSSPVQLLLFKHNA